MTHRLYLSFQIPEICAEPTVTSVVYLSFVSSVLGLRARECFLSIGKDPECTACMRVPGIGTVFFIFWRLSMILYTSILFLICPSTLQFVR